MGGADQDEMDPRPTLDVDNLRSPASLLQARRRAFKKALIKMTKEDRKTLSAVLSKYRRRQTKLLGHKDEDPNPYDSDYVFYCLEDSDSE